MEKRQLGKTGLAVAPLTLGTNVFGWTIDEAKSFEILDAFVDAGYNFIDTANTYSSWVPGNKGGESETIIGNWFKTTGKRDKIVLATKVGSEMNGQKGLSKQYILQAVEESLTRLQTDHIDLYQSHYDFKEPLDDTLEAYTELIKSSKVRAIGASNYSAERLKESLEVSEAKGLVSYQTLQPLYNLYDRAVFEKELQPLCVEHDIAVINYYALASGFLSGKYRSEADLDKSQRGGGVKKYLNERGFRILDALDKVSTDLNATPSQVAIAWLLTRPAVAAPIASATSIDQLTQLVTATQLQLSEAALQLLDNASAE